ncbi:MAG TPA: Rap1a/Tai family immunity protein [Steroidobacteraceae bacterium]|nr:Rap1a/Tai family immunity protein [Steroidobacteraceae bacterium]
MSRQYTMAVGVLTLAFARTAMPVSPDELKEQCREWLESVSTPSALACEGYLRGFLSGIGTGARLHVSAVKDDEESWSDRGARTRVSRTRWARVRQEHICMPQPLPMRDIVERVVEHLESSVDVKPRESTAAAVEATLRRHYGCG